MGSRERVSPPAALPAKAVAYAARIASLAPLSLQGNKRALRELLAAEGALDPAVERELVALRAACFRSEDFFEGVRAFAGEARAALAGSLTRKCIVHGFKSTYGRCR